jgi:hypothetical protein
MNDNPQENGDSTQGLSLMSEEESSSRYTATVESNAFPNAQSKPLVIGGKVYLIYQKDAPQRMDADALRLVTVKQNSTQFDGTTAADVYDDGTQDGMFDAASDGENAFIAWENSSTVFSRNDITLLEYMQANEISVSKWNAAAEGWEAPVTLTSNGVADHIADHSCAR